MKWETAHRRLGQNMDEWIVYSRKTEFEVETQDPQMVISDRQFAHN